MWSQPYNLLHSMMTSCALVVLTPRRTKPGKRVVSDKESAVQSKPKFGMNTEDTTTAIDSQTREHAIPPNAVHSSLFANSPSTFVTARSGSHSESKKATFRVYSGGKTCCCSLMMSAATIVAVRMVEPGEYLPVKGKGIRTSTAILVVVTVAVLYNSRAPSNSDSTVSPLDTISLKAPSLAIPPSAISLIFGSSESQALVTRCI
mmetsp:Transcript_151720/g.264384  ORF Transcript_151720/g.264384 Transcript_151720/m.264384 type:complete len:204 (+) Transcript_151720:849-1460(+)